MSTLPALVVPPGAKQSDDVFFPPTRPAPPRSLTEPDDHGSDIYRGSRPPSPAQSARPESQSSSSSSSASRNVGRRLGALAAVVELAISRWARANSSGSSTSSGRSSSSSDSVTTRTTRARRPRRRPSSIASLHNAQSERVILARKKAREEFRVIPREFVLFLPPSLVPGAAHLPQEQARQQRILRTVSLPLIISQLDAALRTSAKLKKARLHPLGTIAEHHDVHTVARVEPLHHDCMVPSLPAELTIPVKHRKGKHKAKAPAFTAEIPSNGLSAKSSSNGMELTKTEQGWWLDVASPTSEDMRSLGKVLRLHPLTLEDILHQDPREKLELFPKLGYYFIVFRALEGERSRQRFRQFRNKDSGDIGDVPTGPGDEGVIGAVNVYLIVFREGICSFHFEDIAEHADRVRNKVLQLEDTINMSSDWIAHGLLDSIVDAFIPILNSVEKEVEEVDALVLNDSTSDRRGPIAPNISDPRPKEVTLEVAVDAAAKLTEVSLRDGDGDVEKASEPPSTPARLEMFSVATLPQTRFALPTNPLFSLRRIKRRFRGRLPGAASRVGAEQEPSTTSKTLLRMAATRRIVTSMGRLLATKGEVVTQMRKRLLSITPNDIMGTGLGIRAGDVDEVALHLGDIQDHILNLQQALAHYERMLSHSHPAYLSQLRVTLGDAKAGMDEALFMLSVISVAIFCIQILVGVFSMNVRVPKNAHIAGAPFNTFYMILGGSALMAICLVMVVRHWQRQAKVKYARPAV